MFCCLVFFFFLLVFSCIPLFFKYVCIGFFLIIIKFNIYKTKNFIFSARQLVAFTINHNFSFVKNYREDE